MSVQTNHRLERKVVSRPEVPSWAEEDWAVSIDRFLGSVGHLPADVERAYGMLSGPPEKGMVRSLEDVWTAVCHVFFNPARLDQFLMEINPRVVELWRQGTISREQLQFYVLRLFLESAGKTRGRSLDWLPEIPERVR